MVLSWWLTRGTLSKRHTHMDLHLMRDLFDLHVPQ